MIDVEDVHALVASLRRPDAYERLRAMAELRRWRAQAMTRNAAVALLDTVGERTPRLVGFEHVEPGAAIVDLLADQADQLDVTALETAYRRCTGDSQTRLSILCLLARREDRAAAGLLGRLLHAAAADGGLPDPAGRDPLAPWRARCADALASVDGLEGGVPEALLDGVVALVTQPGWAEPAAALLDDLARLDLIGPGAAGRYAAQLAASIDLLDAGTDPARSLALAESLGSMDRLGAPAARPGLHRLLGSADPWAGACAAAVLLGASVEVAPDRIGLLTRDHRARLLLVERLERSGNLDLLPAEVLDRSSLATSALWCALVDRGEGPPTEVELLGRQPVLTRAGAADLFVFGFRMPAGHWSATRGWMGAVCGPYHPDRPAGPGIAPEVVTEFEPLPDGRNCAESVVRSLEAATQPDWRPVGAD